MTEVTAFSGSGVPLGGAGLTVADYADFLAKEYLGGYVRAGGAAVRFVVAGDDEVASRWHAALARVADGEGYLGIGLDAAEVAVHKIDSIYAAVARGVDWLSLAGQALHAAWDELGYPARSHTDLDVADVAAFHRLDPPELARSIRRHLEARLLHDPSLAREFRVAAYRLCQRLLNTGDVEDAECDAVLRWLRAEAVSLRELRPVGLASRVGRHNARGLLVSLAAWRQRVAGTGLVIDLDLTRLATARRPPLDQRDPRRACFYTKGAVLDAYEVLRQLVDATDRLRGALVAVTLPPELVTDPARGLPAYSALHLRVIDEVRDRRRPNPYAALVRLETRLEAVR
jgi:hypothetical protein